MGHHTLRPFESLKMLRSGGTDRVTVGEEEVARVTSSAFLSLVCQEGPFYYGKELEIKGRYHMY